MPGRFGAQLIDRATALALRKITRSGAKARQRACEEPAPDLACPPTIRAIDMPLRVGDPRVEVVIIAPRQAIWAMAFHWVRRFLVGHDVDRAWITAVAVAVSTTLALAIPLEILRQHG